MNGTNILDVAKIIPLSKYLFLFVEHLQQSLRDADFFKSR